MCTLILCNPCLHRRMTNQRFHNSVEDSVKKGKLEKNINHEHKRY